jgi:hypothetical protein
MNGWIDVNKKLPHLTDDFITLLEYQKISSPIRVKLKEGLFQESEIDGYFIIKNGVKMWSFDPCATSLYYNFNIVTHWRYIT